MASRAASMAQVATPKTFLGRSQSGFAASTSFDSSPPVRLHGKTSSLRRSLTDQSLHLDLPQLPPVSTNRQKKGVRASAVFTQGTDSNTRAPTSFVQDSAFVSSPRFDKWLTQAAAEIVRHLGDAPFLHYVFDGRATGGKQQFEQVEPLKGGGWESIQSQVQAMSPDGVILVQRLGIEAVANCYGEEYAHTTENCPKIESCPFASGPRTDVWGLVVQGKRSKKHACYILKTTRAVGCNHACTRFSLTRATCFGPSLHKQLEKSWLAQ